MVFYKKYCLRLPRHVANTYKDHHLVAYREDTICHISASLMTNKVVVTTYYK